MILDKNVEISVNNRNKKRLSDLGYDITKDKIFINPEHLSKGSHVKINVKCEKCKEIFKIEYVKYVKNIERGGFYSCKKCSDIKRSKTNLINYGVKSYTQTEEYVKKTKKTKKEKYGNQNYVNFEKAKKTNIKKYGVDIFSKSDIFLDKLKITCNNKYGVDFPMQYKKTIEKSKKSKKEKYNNEYYNNVEKIKKTKKKNHGDSSYNNLNKMKETKKERYNDEFYNNIEKIKNTNQKNYNVNFPFESKTFREKANNTKIENIKQKYNLISLNSLNREYKLKCEKGHNYSIDTRTFFSRKKYGTEICTICNPIGVSESQSEKFLYDYISSIYKGNIIKKTKNIIKPYELDLYIPEYNIAFEFNGIYWHSEIYKDKYYHLMKTKKCEEKGIKLVHIWEDDWNNKSEIIKSMIRNSLKRNNHKIYARKCKIKEIKDNSEIKDFLNNNHLQGFVGSKIKIGLYYNDELVSFMNFGKKRKFMNSNNIDGHWEMLRFCNKTNVSVVGGASKLFKFFVKNYNPKQIISYADRSHSTGDLYYKLGMEKISETEPNYYYIINGKRIHRFNYRKDILISQGYNPEKSEHQIMLERKIYRIYNSGNFKFSINFENY